MAYRLKRRETIEAAVRRIATEELTAAQERLGPARHSDPVAAVHDVRKRCKKVRGLLRLASPELAKGYKRADRCCRDAARALSGWRDAHAVLATFDRLVSSSDSIPPAFGPIRLELERRAAASSQALADDGKAVKRARSLVTTGLETVERLTVDGDGWGCLAAGLTDTYRQGRRELRAATREPSGARHHELRRWAKYTWYHLRLLERAAPSCLGPLATEFGNLTEGLGDAHDLAVLRTMLAGDPAFSADGVDLAGTDDLIARRQAELERRSLRLAARLYAEKPTVFAARIGSYWDLWHDVGGETAPVYLATEAERHDPLDALTVRDLRLVARDWDIVGRSTKRRDDLLADLRAHGAHLGASPPARPATSSPSSEDSTMS